MTPSPTSHTPTHILVTGGAGFIGSSLIRELLNQPGPPTVVNFDVLGYAGNLDNLKDVAHHPNYHFVRGDIRDEAQVQAAVQEFNIDTVINVAAQTHVDRSITGPGTFVSTNVWGTQVLLEAARQNNVGKFIQISTDEVYGSLGPEGLFTEDTPINPSSPYSASKASADMLALSYWHTYGLPVSITRCSNNYGPYQYPEKLIPFFILKARQGEKVPVYGDGLNVRDWIHVKDHSHAVMKVLYQGQAGRVYNIGASNEQTNLAITRRILQAFGLDDSAMAFVTDRPGHDRRYAIDSTRIQTELGWQPAIDFETGMAETIAWYQEHTDWIEAVLARQKQLDENSDGTSSDIPAFRPGQWLETTPAGS